MKRNRARKPEGQKRGAASTTAMPVALVVNDAMTLVAQGDVRNAMKRVTDALRANRNNLTLLELAAALAQQLRQYEDSERFLRMAIAVKPGNPEYHYNLANLLQVEEVGFSEAEAHYRRAIDLRGQFPEAWLNLGVLFERRGQLAAAEAAFRKAAGQRPDYRKAEELLARVKEKQGLVQSEMSLRAAVEEQPQDAEAHYQLGLFLDHGGRTDEAEAAYRRALGIDPELFEAAGSLAVLLQKSGRSGQAETLFRRIVALAPERAESHYNLGVFLRDTNRAAEAEDAWLRAVQFRPDHLDAWRNLGTVRLDQGRFAESEAAYRAALAVDPDHAEVHYGLGVTFLRIQRFDEAEALFRRARALQPGHRKAEMALGMLLLAEGRTHEGWRLYEARYDPAVEPKLKDLQSIPFPQWNGESIEGKSLLVAHEQGYGDAIQCWRYLPLLKSLGLTKLGVLCPDTGLLPLLASVPGVDRIYTQDEALDFDYWTLPLSLPMRFGTTVETIPGELPYVRVPSDYIEKWRSKLPSSGLRVGLVWRGNPGHLNDMNRSLASLSVLEPLWSVPGVTFVSMQKGAGTEEAATPPPSQPLVDLGPTLCDFADTAAVVSLLDLVICVDTAVAHLAGALGRPCWVLLPFVGTDWRWLLGRDDSPWYPGAMRLYRQLAPGQWDPVVQRLAADLARLAAAAGKKEP